MRCLLVFLALGGLTSALGCDSEESDTVSGEHFCRETANAFCQRWDKCYNYIDADCVETAAKAFDCSGAKWKVGCPREKVQPCTYGWMNSIQCSEFEAIAKKEATLPSMPATCKGICH